LVYPPDTDILHFPLHFWSYNVYLTTFFKVWETEKSHKGSYLGNTGGVHA